MPIALLTDFGTVDGYAGILHGVISGIAPQAKVVDVTHELPPFRLSQAGLTIYRVFRYFPKKSIFVVVVDPEVGSPRKPILVVTQEYFFVGPDNGVLDPALSEQKIQKIYQLKNEDYFLTPVSHTFHGRDVFAPVAAHLHNGVAPKKFGPSLKGHTRLSLWETRIHHHHLEGRIISVDRFGNLITNLRRSLIKKHFPKLNFSVEAGTRKLTTLLRDLHSHYAEGKPQEAILLFGSSDLLEISVNQGSAAKKLRLKVGDLVKIPL